MENFQENPLIELLSLLMLSNKNSFQKEKKIFSFYLMIPLILFNMLLKHENFD